MKKCPYCGIAFQDLLMFCKSCDRYIGDLTPYDNTEDAGKQTIQKQGELSRTRELNKELKTRTGKYHSRTEMDQAINLMAELGWRVESTEIIEYSKSVQLTSKIFTFLLAMITWGGGIFHPKDRYKVIYSKDSVIKDSKSNHSLKQIKDWISKLPRWLRFGLITASTTLVVKVLAFYISEFLFALPFFGFMAPAAIIDFFFFELSSHDPIYDIYYSLMTPLIWFGVGSILGITIPNTRFAIVIILALNIVGLIVMFGFAVTG